MSLPEELRNIAATVSDWDAPIGARSDLHAAARRIEELEKVLHDIIRHQLITGGAYAESCSVVLMARKALGEK